PVLKNLVLGILSLALFATACKNNNEDIAIIDTAVEEPVILQYGFVLNDYKLIRDTIRKGDTFGDILFANGVPQDKILEVATKFRDSFDVRKMVVGKPYVLLKSKDSTNKTLAFIYETNSIDYAVVDFSDSLS